MGAFYDSAHRYFHMKSDVYLERHPTEPHRPAVVVRAGELFYREDAQRIELKGGASIERGTERLEAAEATVHLQDGAVRHVAAAEARGLDQQPEKLVRYSSPQLDVILTPQETIERISGLGGVELSSASPSSKIEVTGGRMDLQYATPPGASESRLRTGNVREAAQIEVSPVTRGGQAGEVRRIQAERIDLKMRESGEDMESITTGTRGRIDLLPSQPQSPKRSVEANWIEASYAVGNRLEKLLAAGQVEVESSAAKQEEPSEALRTWSENFEARFTPESGEMETLRQWTSFRFERGDRRGESDEGLFTLSEDRVELTKQAKTWDSAGTLTAHHIVLDQRTGDLAADGSVSTVFQETKPRASADPEPSGAMFEGDKPVFGTAERMRSEQESGLLVYSGDARLWQGEDRLEAEEIRIERRRNALAARGNVVTFLHEDEPEGATSNGLPMPMRITADSMDYDGSERRAVYSGAAELKQEGLQVSCDRLQGHFHTPEEADAAGQRLRKAIAQGAVTIIEKNGPDLPERRGDGAFAEYEPGRARLILRGDPAHVRNGRGGETRGAELTYHVNDDRLLVLGGENQRAWTLRRRKDR
jgi:lipopolysaccharide transport protein LptA